MRFQDNNTNLDDCMIVALHNAALAAGLLSSYPDLMKICILRNWYKPGQGFDCTYLEEAYLHLKIRALYLTSPDTKDLFNGVVQEDKVYLFLRPQHVSINTPGHAMVALKGQKGVRVLNAYYGQGTGWRTLSKDMKSGSKHIVAEITRIV